MSRSHHVTRKDLKGLSKIEIDQMTTEYNSVLHQLTQKREIKKDVKIERKNKKNFIRFNPEFWS